MIQRVVVERMVQKVVSYIALFALIKMTSELHTVIIQQARVSGRKSTNRKLSLQSSYIAVYDTQRRAVRQTLQKLD